MRIVKLVLPFLAMILANNSLAAVSALSIGETESSRYGYRYNGINNHKARVSFLFPGRQTDLQLSVTGFDIDFETEVNVRVNDTNIGSLTYTRSDKSGLSHLVIPASAQQPGTNVLWFEQIKPGLIWGVTNITLLDTPQLVLGQSNTEQYGNRYPGAAIDQREAVYAFDGQSVPIDVALTGYDIDFISEVRVSVNGTDIGAMSTSPNVGTSTTNLLIPAALQRPGSNELKVTQMFPRLHWGVTNVLLTANIPPQLALNNFDPKQYGWNFNGVSNHETGVDFTFEGQSDTLTLDVAAFDLDSSSEVRVLVNGQQIGFLKMTPNNGIATSALPILESVQVPGTNTLRFEQTVPGDSWGVTDLLLTPGCNYPLVHI